MAWKVLFHDAFAEEFDGLDVNVRDELLSRVRVLEKYGPQLGRPYADTLAGSRHTNMKELRFTSGLGVWRVAYAFDPKRQAVVLVAGDKGGVPTARFYKRLIAVADRRFDDHLKAR